MTAKATAAIVGSGSTPYYFRGESAPQTIYELIGKAVHAAAADAGIGLNDIDGLVFFAFGFDTGLLIEQLGLKNVVFAHCVSGFGSGMAGMFDLAAMGVETGRAKNVVCIGATQQVGRRVGQALGNFAATPDNVFHRIAGLGGPGQALALSARRHMHRYGTRREAFAEVVMASRAAAATRETAFRRKPLSLDEYMAAPMLADPLCKFDFCLETDGALAFVVNAVDRAADRPHRPVWIKAVAQVADPAWGRAFFWLNQTDDAFVSAGAEAVAQRLYARAGLGPQDIDVALLYDHFSPLVIMQLEDYGFCPRGEGGAFVESGAIRAGGTIPVNPHGGHLSEAYVVGVTHVREAVEQLRGTAVNQVAGATTALITGGPAPVPMTGAILSSER
ncbi:thiolase C-terminal domain-containing protein [Novosphingobium sp. JCM 18896]|uniref:thiolase C-terminal domain-containing protein n=1 Tax=Novosphingobium sp. JCM 18896 TaxID=2989731 RepID=UPI002222010E|nr:thiolase [Novosphingobium sp. JCM 18896]MCW1431248.1 thiolase [Novosphingobium sp. JCM 18896]